MASSTLDASAKIYAGRVDAIHSETYKVLSGLGRTGAGGKEEVGEDGKKIYPSIFISIFITLNLSLH